MSSNDNITLKINEEIKKYEILKKSFLKIYQAEYDANEKSDKIYQSLIGVNFENDILNKHYHNLIRDMNDLGKNKMTIVNKEIKDLILNVTDFYPQRLKQLKEEMTRIAGQSREIEDKLDKFEKERVNDNKYLFLHFLYSELEYHYRAIEKMSQLFRNGKEEDPREKLLDFMKDSGINVNYNRYRMFDMDKITKNRKEREKRKKIEKKKEEDDITNTYNLSESSEYVNNKKENKKSKNNEINNNSQISNEY